MCRPRSSLGNQVISAALVALALAGCGKGLFTRSAPFRDGSGGDTGTGTSTSTDVNVPDSGPIPDVAPKLDVDPASCPPYYVSNGVDSVIPCGEATLFVPKEAVPTGGPYAITLRMVSRDGSLTLPNGDGTMQEYGGAIGPVYSITPEFGWWKNAILKIRISPPDSSIPRVGMAYVDGSSKVLVLDKASSFDPATNEVTGYVYNKMSYFAPVETCDGDGGTCHLDLRCKAEACQR